MMKLNY